MAVVHLGRLRGDAGFARPVAIKRLHRQYVGDPDLTALLLDEARLASRLQHPNLVVPSDLITSHGEIFVVMEYVHGLTLAALVREARTRGQIVPVWVVTRVMSDVLTGLQAAHEAKDGRSRPLALVHRDVSPQNVMVGADGLARVLDFGIAHAAFRSQTTREGQLRAKLAYAAPEHVLDRTVDRRADVYSSAIVCWELLTLERLFSASNESALLARVLEQAPEPASKFRPEISPELDQVLLGALSKDPDRRPATAEEFALALERVAPPASHREVARWVASLGSETLDRLEARLAEMEAGGSAQETPIALAPLSTDTRTSERHLPYEGETASLTPSHTAKTARRSIAVAGVVGLALTALVATPVLIAHRSPWGSRALASPPTIADMPAQGEIPQAAAVPPAPSEPDSDGGLQASATEPSPVKSEKKPPMIAPATRPARRPSPRPTADDCSQLTELGADGIRHVKRHCLN
jgi:serine/threonine-protein kinase